MPDIDNRPYWQRQGRSVEGWKKRRYIVQAWKQRNPEANRRHARTQYARRKLKYGHGRTDWHDLAYLEMASQWNDKVLGNERD